MKCFIGQNVLFYHFFTVEHELMPSCKYLKVRFGEMFHNELLRFNYKSHRYGYIARNNAFIKMFDLFLIK